MSHRRVLITGGAGFIGSALVRRLAGSCELIRVLDNLSPQVHGQLPAIDGAAFASAEVQVVRGDVVERGDLERALEGITEVIHLAAETGTGQSMYEIARYERVNGYGTAQLLDVLANRPHKVGRLVLASSRAVYGEGQYACPQHGVVQPAARGMAQLKQADWSLRCPGCARTVEPVATRETAVPQPASIYAATKLAQEELVRIACGSLGIPFVILRFQNVYGPGQSLGNPYTGILSIFSTRIRRGLELPIFEDGKESRDFVHVNDVTQAIRLAMESDVAAGKVLNVGSGQPTTVYDVASLLVKVLEGRSAVEVTGHYRLGDIRHCYADLTAIRKATGFEPQVNLEEGLRSFARWVLSQPLPEDRLAGANKELSSRGLMP